MVATLALGIATTQVHRFVQEWEEPMLTQLEKTYHPLVQFQGADKFAWTPPDAPIAYGTFAVDGTHYTFTPTNVLELNLADVDKLAADGVFDLEEFKKAWAVATKPFTGDYNPESRTLVIHLNIKGTDIFDYSLANYTDGDDTLPSNVNEVERKIVGLWRGIDRFPNRYDTKTRYRWQGIDGLKDFLKESSQAASACFNLLDFRQDKTMRDHATLFIWWQVENTQGYKAVNEAKGIQRIFSINEKGHLVDDQMNEYERVG